MAGTEVVGGTVLTRDRKKLSLLTVVFLCIFCTKRRRKVKMNMKEALMFQVTAKASEKIQEFFKDRQDAAIIRIFLSQGG